MDLSDLHDDASDVDLNVLRTDAPLPDADMFIPMPRCANCNGDITDEEYSSCWACGRDLCAGCRRYDGAYCSDACRAYAGEE